MGTLENTITRIRRLSGNQAKIALLAIAHDLKPREPKDAAGLRPKGFAVVLLRRAVRIAETYPDRD